MVSAPKFRLLALLLLGFPCASRAAEMYWQADYRPAFSSFIERDGSLYGLSQDDKGTTFLTRKEPQTGKTAAEPLTGAPLQQLEAFIGQIPAGQVEPRMAQALHLYLNGRSVTDAAFAATLFEKGPDGKERLTALGRGLLIDILTAQDGTQFKETPDFQSTLDKAVKKNQDRLGKIPAGGLDESGLGHLFDGSSGGSGAQCPIGAFDWSSLGPQPSLAEDPGLKEYAVDEQRGVVRVMVAAKTTVARDVYDAPAGAAASAKVLKEAGLDAGLFARNSAKVVRALDDIVTVEVPLSNAVELGTALQQEGVYSRPARVFHAAAAAVPASPFTEALTQFLPVPNQELMQPENIAPLNYDAERLLGFSGLWKKGMTGKDAVVGVIDSGVDAAHPDFKGRVIDYVDLTGEGDKDSFGHGTHVAGTLAGSGVESKGKFKGAAPETKLVVFKVFGKDGNTSEDTILAAMKKAAELPPELRPQVLNLSLGGPGDAATDPLSQMANRLMLKDNILVVAAAGNSGPGAESVSAPGNAQYVLTVTGVNKEGQFPFFSSRGPINDAEGQNYGKPDLSTVAGDVNLKGTNTLQLLSPAAAGSDNGGGGMCVYGPGGVISDRSSDDPDKTCTVLGYPGYRYMAGTSMAAPMASGAAADVIGYMRSKGADYSATGVKAVLMETAKDLNQPVETQGAGLMDGAKLAATVISRVAAGVPIGNIAYMLSVRLTTDQRKALDNQKRFQMTPLGIVDTSTGRMIKTDAELFWMMQQLKGPMAVAYNKNTPPAQPSGV